VTAILRSTYNGDKFVKQSAILQQLNFPNNPSEDELEAAMMSEKFKYTWCDKEEAVGYNLDGTVKYKTTWYWKMKGRNHPDFEPRYNYNMQGGHRDQDQEPMQDPQGAPMRIPAQEVQQRPMAPQPAPNAYNDVQHANPREDDAHVGYKQDNIVPQPGLADRRGETMTSNAASSSTTKDESKDDGTIKDATSKEDPTSKDTSKEERRTPVPVGLIAPK